MIGSSGPDAISVTGSGIDLTSAARSEMEVTYPTVMSLVKILSGDGADSLRTDAFQTYVDAGPGDDTIQASVYFQTSTYDGGTGSDAISYAASKSPPS